jgi:hypothetical protein
MEPQAAVAKAMHIEIESLITRLFSFIVGRVVSRPLKNGRPHSA